MFKKPVLFAVLALVAMPAFAAVNMSMGGIVEIILWLIGAAIIFSILYIFIDKAPFILEPWKTYIKYALYVLAGLAVIFWILGMMGQSPINFR